MKIAIFGPNWVGDLVMATPALRAIRQRHPHAEITALVRPHLPPVLAGLTLVDRVISHPATGRVSLPTRLRAEERWARGLRSERFDLAVLLPNSLHSALWAWWGGARERVGFDGNGRGWLLTRPVARRPRNQPYPVLDEYLRLAEAAGCPPLGREMELACLPTEREEFELFWRQSRGGRAPQSGIVCLNPGGAFGAAKHWPSRHFAELARRLVTRLDREVLVLCGPAERESAREIVRLADHPRVGSLAEAPVSLGLTKAAVAACELLVTTDSGPRHFGAPLGKPVITLYGPTHQAWSETHYHRGVALQLAVDCGPCQKRVCPLGHHRCLEELSVDQVFAAATAALSPRSLPRVA
ncbi:MAG: lipopolysaccharide heptosyltransferase II [Planctomycetaceae bacterium]